MFFLWLQTNPLAISKTTVGEGKTSSTGTVELDTTTNTESKDYTENQNPPDKRDKKTVEDELSQKEKEISNSEPQKRTSTLSDVERYEKWTTKTAHVPYLLDLDLTPPMKKSLPGINAAPNQKNAAVIRGLTDNWLIGNLHYSDPTDNYNSILADEARLWNFKHLAVLHNFCKWFIVFVYSDLRNVILK